MARVAVWISVLWVLALTVPGIGHSGEGIPERPNTAFVVSDGDIYGPAGERFIVRGVIAFNRAFATFRNHPHEDWAYRSATVPEDRISPPTGFLDDVYVDSDTAYRQLAVMRSYGVNLVRIFVEPAIFNTAAYTDESSGLSFPPEPEVLDDVIASAAHLGMVVQLQPGEDNVSDAMLGGFMGRLAARYRDQWNVWLHASNEPYSTGMWRPDGQEVYPHPDNRNNEAWADRVGGRCEQFGRQASGTRSSSLP
ncbi:hypothetical protein [Lutibaculum baratangense]|uniref:hypothetical protein n=1 Tax=Lutibaculum baratangense TaxID=1358440 RepID=UPI00058DED31|nr:hypothetical protein [Lutibaculum baratangense]